MRWSARPRALLAALVAVVFSGCALPAEQLALPGSLNGATGSVASGAPSAGRYGVPLSAPGDRGTTEPRSYPGTGQLTGSPDSGFNAAGVRQSTTGGVTINVVDASVAEVARSVLGETMGVTYVVDPRVKGSLTLRTAQPVPKEALVEIFEQALRSEGAVMVVEGGVYKIMPAEALGNAVAGLRSGSRGRRPGYGTEIIPLKYVSAEEIERVIKAVAPQASIVRVDPNRNLVMVAGTSLELTSIRETVSVFDVDWMRGMSFALYPVETGDPEAIVQELDTIFANDRDSPTKGVVRFVPNRRLKSILVITSRPDYLTKASTWLKRIDMAGRATEKQVHVYHVQNRPASELSALLQRVYTSQARVTTGALPTSPAAGQVSLTGPADAPTTENSNGSSGNGRRGFDSGVPIFSPVPLASPPSPAVPPPGSADAGQPIMTAGANSAAAPVPGDDRAAGISVIADEANNSLIITATPAEYKRIQQILTRIDIAPSQVLLEATIAEVTLNDRLKFGLRWFFRAGDSQLRLTDSAVGAVGATFPGFSYFLNVPNVQVALNALTTVTDVNVVSSPSLVVLDNKKATLQVGAEVPVATQSAVSIISPGAPIVNSVTFRSTGVILGITPRISENGRVLLEIEQEVSDVVPTTTSNIDSPTIQQRRVKTTVAVNDGESIVLAGLMQDTNTITKKQIPLVGQLPVVGNLFRDKDDEIKRTELLIAITPQIVKDAHQMRAIASEFRDRMNFTTRPQRRAPPDRREQVDRLVR